MRTTSPSPATLIQIGAGQERSPGLKAPGEGLRAGAVVSLRVVEDRGGGRYGLSLAAGGSGPLLGASSDRPLALGSTFSARVERQGGALFLRPLPSRPESAPAPRLPPLPRMAANEAIMAALLREGTAPRPEALERLRRLLARPATLTKGEREEGALLALGARLEAAGIPAEPGIVEAVQAEVEGGGGGGGHSGDDAGRGEEGGSEGRPETGGRGAGEGQGLSGGSFPASIDADLPFEAALGPEDLSLVLGRLLKALSLRAGGEGSYLNLFNHRPGPDGSWTYAPFRFELDSIAFEGLIRIKSPRIRGGPGRIEADFRARELADEGPGRSWSLGFAFGGKPSLSLACDEGPAAEAARKAFPSLEAALHSGGRAVEASFAVASSGSPVDRVPGALDVRA